MTSSYDSLSDSSDYISEGDTSDEMLVDTNSDYSDDSEVSVQSETVEVNSGNNHVVSYQPETTWREVDGSSLHSFFYPPKEMIFPITNKSPISYFREFFSDEILECIVKNSNSYIQNLNTSPSSKTIVLETSVTEILKFLGVVIYLGIDKKPKIADYWSKNILYKNEFCQKIMTRDRFMEIIKCIHFTNAGVSEPCPKIGEMLVILIENFQKMLVPGENVVIDESLISWLGRLKFRQYIPSKTHRYGIKLYKLTNTAGYILNLSVYQGKDKENANIPATTSICKRLMEEYFDCGRTLTVDNFYTSINLAELCLSRDTHLRGTLRANQKGFPKFTAKSVKKGEVMCKEKNGIVCGIWKDKRDVRFVSTKECGELIESPKPHYSGKIIKKPDVIFKYNDCKQGFDVSDQLDNYYSPLRKTIKWFHKLAFELLLNTATVNASILFHSTTNKKMSMSKFRESLIFSLTGVNATTKARASNNSAEKHELTDCTTRLSNNRIKRRRCIKCYAEIAQNDINSARNKAKTVTTFCNACPNQPFMCLQHFNSFH